ncbi:MAG: hypothetical protein NC826_05500 [Candidatus Omnitrophica bacterium]|nr:hypothetical protein [Candidatus Omnitrophota bacterium]
MALFLFNIIIGLLICFNPMVINAQENTQSEEISVEGRIIVQKAKPQDNLILYARDGKVYNIYGEFKDLIQSMITEIGDKNWVILKGKTKGKEIQVCHKKTVIDKQGNPSSETECFWQYSLYVNKIDTIEASEKETPRPQMSVQKESTSPQILSIGTSSQVFWIKGKIENIDIKSPFKNLEVAFFDKDKNLIRKNIIINKNTKVVKTVEKEPIYLSLKALKINQKVLIEYMIDPKDQTATAIAITILED